MCGGANPSLSQLAALACWGVTAGMVAGLPAGFRVPKSIVSTTQLSTGEAVFFQTFQEASCYFSSYDDTAWGYADDDVPVTEEGCAAACLEQSECTGFELYHADNLEYCSFWLGGACGHENMNPADGVATYVLMDGVARFMDRYCVWDSSFTEGEDYVTISSNLSWHDCLETCDATDSILEWTSNAPSTFTEAPAAAGALQNSSGPCTGVEAVYLAEDGSNSPCALYFDDACMPSQMTTLNDQVYDTARLYETGQNIERQLANTLDIKTDTYDFLQLQTFSSSPVASLNVGFEMCNPGSEILRGYDSCAAYVNAFPCDCDNALVSDICVGNTTAVAEQLWITSLMLPLGVQCAGDEKKIGSGFSFPDCRESCFTDPDCTCFKFTEEDGSFSVDGSTTGTCSHLSGGVVEESMTAAPATDDGDSNTTSIYYTYLLSNTEDQEVPFSQICPLECLDAADCENPSTWTPLVILFLCCLIFALLSLLAAIGKCIYNVVQHHRHTRESIQRQQALAMTTESINEIQTEIFQPSSWKEGHGDPQCIICLADFASGDKLRVLSCGHRFHVNCIDKWLKQQGVCPICKIDVRKDSNHIEDPLDVHNVSNNTPAGVFRENADRSHDASNASRSSDRDAPSVMVEMAVRDHN